MFEKELALWQARCEPLWHFSGHTDGNHLNPKYKTIMVPSQLPWSVLTRSFVM